MNPIDTPPEGYPPDKRANYEHGFKEQKHETNWFDSLLKKIMPNGTVMRRYILLGVIAAVVAVIVAIVLIERADRQQFRTETAVCATVRYAERQSARILATLDSRPPEQRAGAKTAASDLEDLANQMRSTGVRCPSKQKLKYVAP